MVKIKAAPPIVEPRESDKLEKIGTFHHLPLQALPAGSLTPGYEISQSRLNWLKGADWLAGQDIDVLNVSMGPSKGVFDENDPMQIATRYFVDKKIPVVVAAGNRGPKESTLQPLALAPWVISVGAVDENCNLLDISSRGEKNGVHPTVVSYGATDHIDEVQDYYPSTTFAAVFRTISRTVELAKKAQSATSCRAIMDPWGTPRRSAGGHFAQLRGEPAPYAPPARTVRNRLECKGK